MRLGALIGFLPPQSQPTDLAEQAKKSPLYGQFNPKASQMVSRPGELPRPLVG